MARFVENKAMMRGVVGPFLARLLPAFVAASLMGAIFIPQSARALVITYATASQGGSTWRYSYTVSGYAFSQYSGFQIHFDPNVYENLEGLPVAPNMDWSPLAWQPDKSIPWDGIYDAFALVPDPSLADPFDVSVDWLGSGSPGSQNYDIYSCADEFCGTGLAFLASGATVAASSPGGGGSVPEPGTLPLAVLGLAVLANIRKVGQRGNKGLCSRRLPKMGRLR